MMTEWYWKIFASKHRRRYAALIIDKRPTVAVVRTANDVPYYACVFLIEYTNISIIWTKKLTLNSSFPAVKCSIITGNDMVKAFFYFSTKYNNMYVKICSREEVSGNVYIKSCLNSTYILSKAYYRHCTTQPT